MSLAVFFQQMMILYLIGFIGFITRKKDILNQHANGVFTQLILSLTLPFLIIYSMDQPFTSDAVVALFWLIPMSTFIMIIASIIACYIRKGLQIPADQQHVLEGVIIFGNQGFIGFALIASLFPDLGALYVTVFNLPYLIFIWTYGVYLFIRQKSSLPWKSIFLNPGIVATFIGMLILLTPIRLPIVVADTFQTIGIMTIPLSMLVIGTFVADMHLNRSMLLALLKNKMLWIVTFLRLLIIPLLLIPFYFLSLSFPVLLTAVIVSGTPSAPTIALFAQKYGGDKHFAAICSFWTTVLSILTLPILYMLVHLLY